MRFLWNFVCTLCKFCSIFFSLIALFFFSHSPSLSLFFSFSLPFSVFSLLISISCYLESNIWISKFWTFLQLIFSSCLIIFSLFLIIFQYFFFPIILLSTSRSFLFSLSLFFIVFLCFLSLFLFKFSLNYFYLFLYIQRSSFPHSSTNSSSKTWWNSNAISKLDTFMKFLRSLNWGCNKCNLHSHHFHRIALETSQSRFLPDPRVK